MVKCSEFDYINDSHGTHAPFHITYTS